MMRAVAARGLWTATALSLALVSVLAGGAHAFTVRGTIVNGTTGQPADGEVIAVNPSAGMLQEVAVQSTNGTFVIENLNNDSPFYLVRVVYNDVNYNEPLQVDGKDKDITIEVYETTTSWESVHVTMPHIAAVREGDQLVIEQLFEIENASEPARTINGEDGYFRVFIPADVDTVTQFFVTTMQVPIDRTPLPTATPNEFYIDYPIRPGITRVGLTYRVPYASGQYDLAEPILYEIGHVSVFAVDPAMQITSSTHTLEAQAEVHGMAVWTLHGLTPASNLELKFVGGHEHAPEVAGAESGGGGTVGVEAGESEPFSRYLMVTLALVLATLVFVVLRGTNNPLTDAEVLRNHYELLVTRLARLDDMHAAGAVSRDAYQATREGLMIRLGVIAAQLRIHGDKVPEAKPKPEAAPHAVKPTQAS